MSADWNPGKRPDTIAPHGTTDKVYRPIPQPDGRIKSDNTAGGLLRPDQHGKDAQGTTAPKDRKGL
jgi:hypothetical protein